MPKKKTTARRRALRQIILGLALVAIGSLGFSLPFVAYTTNSDWKLLDAQASKNAQYVAAAAGVDAPNTESNAHYEITNRLSIPKIGVDMPLVQGGEASSLLKGGWVFPGTALPGTVGNSVVFGHRFRYLPPVSNTFFKLDELTIGDTFTAHWNGVDYVYKVSDIRVIEPTDFSVVAPSTDSRMTLITCAPAFSNSHRLVVIGELVSQ